MFPLLLQADGNLYTNNTVLVFGVLTLALLGYWYYKAQKKNPDLDFGPLMATTMVSKHETFFMILIFAEYLFAAMVAATRHVPGSTEIEMSPIGRIGMHVVIAFAGTIAQFTLARDVAVQFTKMGIGERIGNIITLFIICLVAFGVPYANLMLIASAGGESLAFDLWFYSLNPFVSDSTIAAKNMELGLPPNYRPWQNLSSAMHVCIITTLLSHYALAFVEALRTISSPVRRKILMDRVKAEQVVPADVKPVKPIDPNKAQAANSSGSTPDKVKEIEPNAKYLLRRIGYTDDAKITNLVKQIQTAIVNNHGQGDDKQKIQLKLAYRMAQLKLHAETLDKSNDTDKSAKKKQLEEDIRTFFTANNKEPDLEKRGLGLTIKAKN